MQLELVDISIEKKEKYSVALVSFRKDGKLQEKKVMSFGSQESAFKVLSEGKLNKGDLIDVEQNKNANGYWDWIKVTKGSASAPDVPAASRGAASPARSNYETPEERLARQVYIVRQSSIGHAIEHLNHVKKAYDLGEVLTVAATFEEYVFGKAPKLVEAPKTLAEMPDDIPY